ncbi:MAG: polysaccharide deacetylase family protein [Eubacteriaceae bacterium]|nr:polysaccharide deacetylase family protein [Eubacteriaceae bacterium]
MKKIKATAITAILTAAAAYTLIPNFWMRNLSKKPIRKIQGKDGRIALTFDDGPDSLYTPELLDLLKAYGAKATFFVVARKARENPQLIQRINEEGHTIAMHTWSHRIAWVNTPERTKNEFEKSLEVFRELGIEIKYFRPPWGTFNLFTYPITAKYGIKTILWSLELYDWRRDTGASDIFRNLKEYCSPGDIVLLHDSGGDEGAPRNTLDAMKKFLPWCRGKGFQLVNMEVGLE